MTRRHEEPTGHRSEAELLELGAQEEELAKPSSSSSAPDPGARALELLGRVEAELVAATICLRKIRTLMKLEAVAERREGSS